MTLLYRITIRISVALLVLFAIWATAFYYIMVDEINDETDDALETYSGYIITRALAGEQLPYEDNGTNNTYFIKEVSEQYAEETPWVQYIDEMIYIYALKEEEPARTLKTIYRDADDRLFELTVSIPTFEKDDLLTTMLSWIIILYFMLLLAILIVNSIVLRHSFRPLYAMLNWIDRTKLGKEIPVLVNDTEIEEFRKLNDALRRSAERNAEMYQQQSMFIGHASHELQTPIAICRNRLEMLCDDPSISENQLEEILKTLQTLDHLSRLNKTLLLLTKIENRQFPSSTEVNINRLAADLAGNFAEIYEHLDFSISDRSPLRVEMNDILASVLISNLIKNACVHNTPNGKVEITTTPDGIVVSNTSENGALNPEYIYKRFYQTRRKEGSTGLGLSLVESICKLYDLKIDYSYRSEMHIFVVDMSLIRI